ncbi:MAG TPA: O-antigen ligase family protein, partial [Bryobacteraceae bacterium]|nr:O-antigen ligase family protein [Bryobacteraceae bacterium]
MPRENVLLLPGCAGFYLAAHLCITYLFFQAEPQTGAMVAFALQSALVAATAFYSFGPGHERLWAMVRIPPLRWVLGFLAVGLCSLSWSATVSLPVAVGYWIELAGQVVMIVLVLRAGPAEAVAGSVARGYVAGACLIALITWLSPTMEDLRPGNNDFFSPNAIGFTCALGIYLLQYVSRREAEWRAGSGTVAVLLAITLLRTLSKTTIAAFAVGQVYLLFFDRGMSRKSKVALGLASLVVIGAFWPLILHYTAVYENAGNQAETLTGRLGIWTFVLAQAQEQPWIGHGFHSFRNVIPPFGSFEAWHAHNELLQQFYTYGVIGVVLLVGTYGSLHRYAKRVAAPEVRVLVTSLLLFVVVRGLADTENFDLSLPLWLIALLSLTLGNA